MRTTALALLAAAALLVGGCAEPETTATDGGTVVPSGAVSAATAPGSATTGPKASGTTSAKATTASPAALPQNFVALDKTITDTGLGHKILVSRMLRNLPWPEGYRASSEAYELVALEVTFTPGTAYTAPLRLQDLSITTGSLSPSRPDTLDNTLFTAAKLPLLPPTVANGSSAKGWVVFRVDPKGAPSLTLTYTRPASQVTDTGQVFATRAFPVALTG